MATSIADILTLTRDALDTWARTHGGGAEIAGDPAHLFSLLQHAGGAVRACVMFRSEKKRGDFEEARYIDRTFTVVISRGRGFSAQPGDSLIQETATGAPLYDLVEQARDIVSAIDYPTDDTEFTADYTSIDLFEFPTDTAVDAYQLSFSIGVQLPSV